MSHSWTHPWCKSPCRDEAVRAAEDNRTGPLPTLEDVIARPFANTQGTCEQSAPAPPFAQPAKCSPAVSETGETQSRLRTERVTERRPPQPGGGGNVTDLRTERVTLEVTHSVPVAKWDWTNILETFRPGESVRVVEETHFDDLAHVALERDAAIRERDAAKSDAEKLAVRIKSQAENVAYFRRDRDETVSERDAAIRERDKLRAERITQTLTADRFAEAVAEADALRGRVAELESQLESVADRAAAAETALESAPAASGAAVDLVLRDARLRDESRTEAYVASLDDASGAAGTEAAGTELPTE